MELGINRIISLDEMGEMMQSLSLTKHPEIKPYKDADIQRRLVSTNEFAPASFYALRSHLEWMRTFQEELKRIGIDFLALKYQGESVGGIEFSYNKGEGAIIEARIVPPVIELPPENVWALVDGLHRSFLAREQDAELATTWVSGASSQYPFYAYPNPNGWDDVKVWDVVPPTDQKKLYRNLPDQGLVYSDLYRNIPGTSQIRVSGTSV